MSEHHSKKEDERKPKYLNYSNILKKIKHKPILLESIFSFSERRPYIIIDFISKDKKLKSSMKETFSHAKRDNNLSSELNQNIEKYIIYRKIYENFPKNIQNIKNNFKHLYEELNSACKPPLNNTNFFEQKEVEDFMKEVNLKKIEENKVVEIIENYLDKNYNKYKTMILKLFYQNYEKNKYRTHGYEHFHYQYTRYYDYAHNQYIDRINENIFLEKYKECIDSIDFFNKTVKEDLHTLKHNNLEKITYPLTFYEYCAMPYKLLQKLLLKIKGENDVETFFEIIYSLFKKYFVFCAKENFDFHKYQNLTKKIRGILRQTAETKMILEKNCENSIMKIIINCILENNKNISRKNLFSFAFDYLSCQDNVLLYNIQKNKNLKEEKKMYALDEEYLKIIEKKKVKQNISLICIINRYKYNKNISSVTYPHINSLHFTLFKDTTFNPNFMFYNIPVNEIYSIFVNYFSNIKYYKNIKRISFGNELLMNKNDFLSYNDEYYQSFISYLIDQFFSGKENSEKKLEEVDLEEIVLNEYKLNNYYERFKVFYGFNKMFPKLHKKKLVEIKYEDCINKEGIHETKVDSSCKMLIVDCGFHEINEINTFIENIDKYLSNKNNNNIEILSLINCKLSDKVALDNFEYNNLTNFHNLKNLKEFFINNSSNVPITNLSLSQILKIKMRKDNKFIYTGYDINNNLIFYRMGSSKIQSKDILDLFNLFNKSIIKLSLIHENIDLIYNTNKTSLKIVNLARNNKFEDKANHKNDKYYFPIHYLSDFIYHQKNLTVLDIRGFGFAFDEIKNKNVNKLFINYFFEEKCEELFEYKFSNVNKNYKYQQIRAKEDVNLKNKFPKLEELNIGNMENLGELYNKIMSMNDKNIVVNKIATTRKK